MLILHVQSRIVQMGSLHVQNGIDPSATSCWRHKSSTVTVIFSRLSLFILFPG